MCKYDEDRRDAKNELCEAKPNKALEKAKKAGEFLKDFVFDHDPCRVKYVWNKSYKIKFHTACDLFPIYVLPQFAIYKWVRNIGFSFGFLFFRIDIDFISLLD